MHNDFIYIKQDFVQSFYRDEQLEIETRELEMYACVTFMTSRVIRAPLMKRHFRLAKRGVEGNFAVLNLD